MVHRSVFVNIKEIKTYDHVNGIMSFTNHHQTSMISRDKKKELLKVLTEQDINFTKQHGKYTGFVAEIIQHEIDHTNGIII